MTRVEWQTEAPARLLEFRRVLQEATAFYAEHPDSPAMTRIFLTECGRISARRMPGRFEMDFDVGITFPICDIDSAHPRGRGWMSCPFDAAFTNAEKMRCAWFEHRSQKFLLKETA